MKIISFLLVVASVFSLTEKEFYDYLKQQGEYNDYGVAGLMGNIYGECGLRANNLENAYNEKLQKTDAQYTQEVDNGIYTEFVTDKAGYGLGQWAYHTRKQSLLDYKKQEGKSIGDPEMQIRFMTNEIKKDYSSVLKILQNATSVREASDACLIQYYAREGEEAQKNLRAAYGQRYYDLYHPQ